MNNRTFVSKNYFACLLTLLLVSNELLADEVRIGIRSIRGAELTIERWQPTIDHLAKKLPHHTFKLIPYEINSQLNQAGSRREFEFVLTNPAAHIEQQLRFGATPIATLINKRKGKTYQQFGTVIFTHSGRSDIKSIEDLKGKTFMGADEQGFGGWRVAWYEMLNNGVDPYRDFKRLSFGGGIQYNVVYAVLEGKVDAGAVRTDMLEGMAQRGAINLSDIKVLGEKKTPGFELLHSTALYPEWPFAKLEHTSQELASEVAAVLYGITEDSEAARSAKYAGWTFPLDYSPVNKLLKDLRVGPYKVTGPLSWHEVLAEYWIYAIVFLLLFTIVIVNLTVVVRSNRQLKLTQASLQSEIMDHQKTDEELERSRRMLQLVLDTIPVRVFWKDINLKYLGCNRLFALDAGLETPGDLIGKTDLEMGWTDQMQPYRQDDQEIIKHGESVLNYIEPQTTPAGEKVWMEISKIPLTDLDGKIIGILGTYSDISERKRYQQELVKYKNQLEEKVAERTAALTASNRELESYSYSIAHDLRSPLRSLIGFSQILKQDASDKLDQEELESLGRIILAGKHMAELIDDILELSRITRNDLNIKPVNISDIARGIVNDMSSINGKRNIEWKIHDGMVDKGDENLLKLLIQNLIDNACKFTRDVKKPVIEIGQHVNGQGNVYYVQDNGIGFDMQFADKIFLPFRRLHSDEFAGTGIGLATVQRIVQRHGGDIWPEAHPEKGASFHFTLNPGQYS